VRIGGPGGSEPVRTRRWLARGAVAVSALAAGAGVGVALAGSGGLDPTFGTGGATILERQVSTWPTPAAPDPGEKIVAVTSPSNGTVVVSRFLPNGAPDPTFDGDGQAVIKTAGALAGSGVAVQPDGKIVVVGFSNIGGGEDATVWRLTASGELDPTFGDSTTGTTQIHTGTLNLAEAVVIQPDEKIVVAGTIETSAPQKVGVWRLTASGAPDPEFGSSGAVEISDGKEDLANALALAPDGKIVVAGSTTLALPSTDAVAWRLTTAGALDTTFDTDGQADVDNGGSETANAVAVQPDGKIVMAGSSSAGLHGDNAVVWRLKPNGGTGATNGALDPTFDTDGVAGIEDGGFAEAKAMALQPDGKILLAGISQVGTGPYTAVIWRLNASGGPGPVDGALDPTFGSGGVSSIAEGSSAEAMAIALEPDRRVVAAGPIENVPNGSLLVFRALGDPFTVTVAKAGTGSGSVQSSPPGIGCGSSCSGPFDDGSQVTLTATPSAGSAFAGWSGAGCAGTGTCELTMSADQSVTATFDAAVRQPTKATITALRESNSTFTVGPSSTPLTGKASARRHKRGTVFSFQLDQAATVKIAIQTRARGRRVGRSCRPARRRLRHKPRCTRTVNIRTLSRSAQAGLNKVAFSGRIGSKALPPGHYQVIFTAVDSAGASPPKTLSLTVVRRSA
jgi:uncharacterized delta-60 repeat protein